LAQASVCFLRLLYQINWNMLSILLAAQLTAHARPLEAAPASVGLLQSHTAQPIMPVHWGGHPVLTLRGGNDQKARERALQSVTKRVMALRKTQRGGKVVSDLGSQMDGILADALGEAGEQDGLRDAVLTSLEPVFMQQIFLLKEAALEQFKKGLVSGSVDEAMAKAEEEFVREATASVPEESGWSFESERRGLVDIMRTVKKEKVRADKAKLESGDQLQTAMQYLSMQQQQMRAIQAQYMGGGGGKWNAGFALRPPNTNLNLGASYSEGRGNLQISMVPDEGAHLLGPNGFTVGVGPANLGLSFNIHV